MATLGPTSRCSISGQELPFGFRPGTLGLFNRSNAESSEHPESTPHRGRVAADAVRVLRPRQVRGTGARRRRAVRWWLPVCCGERRLSRSHARRAGSARSSRGSRRSRPAVSSEPSVSQRLLRQLSHLRLSPGGRACRTSIAGDSTQRRLVGHEHRRIRGSDELGFSHARVQAAPQPGLSFPVEASQTARGPVSRAARGSRFHGELARARATAHPVATKTKAHCAPRKDSSMRYPAIARCAGIALISLTFAACDKKTDAEPRAAASAADHAPSGVKPGSHEDWCGEHQVPESLCTRCNPSLIAAFKATGDWCEEHGLPESQCKICNPKLVIERPPPAKATQ